MTNQDYISNCIKTEAPVTDSMKERFNERNIRLLHGAMGMCTESAELLDALKKHIYYGKELDITNIFEEIGDELWYIALICNELGFKIEDIMETNIKKLAARYPEKFSEEKAINRNLDVERKILENE